MTPPPTASERLSLDDAWVSLCWVGTARRCSKASPSAGFGVSGEASIWQILPGAGARFYGMGEKTFGRVELSGLRTRFWNTDVWGDFHPGQWGGAPTDPPYASVPYVVVRQGDEYVGLLLHTSLSRLLRDARHRREPRLRRVAAHRPPAHPGRGRRRAEPVGRLRPFPSGGHAEAPEAPRHRARAAALVLGYHQSRWGYGGAQGPDGARRELQEARHPLRRPLARPRLHGRLPGLHVDEAMFPEGTQPTAERWRRTGGGWCPSSTPA